MDSIDWSGLYQKLDAVLYTCFWFQRIHPELCVEALVCNSFLGAVVQVFHL